MMGGLDWAALDWVIEILGVDDVETLVHDLMTMRANL